MVKHEEDLKRSNLAGAPQREDNHTRQNVSCLHTSPEHKPNHGHYVNIAIACTEHDIQNCEELGDSWKIIFRPQYN